MFVYADAAHAIFISYLIFVRLKNAYVDELNASDEN